jgi:GT2 family glycosyltransferase
VTAKVVILNWNGAEILPRFLPSVVAGTPPEVEIVVVDNGSTDGSVELLRRDFPSVYFVELDRNYGFAGGYNRALAKMEADGKGADIYILLNSDVETPAGWCEPLIEMLLSRPEVAAVAPKILSYAERDHFEYAGASGGFIDFLGYPFCRGRILNMVESDHGQYDDAREVFWATGACFVCRADVFRSIGGFDETFFAHQEEIDLCWRMQLAGWRIMVEPRSAVYHLGAGTLPPSPQKLYLNHRNNLAMLYKNLPRGRMQAVVFVRMLLDGLEALVRLVRGETKNFSAIVRAHRDFRKMVREDLRKKRLQIRSTRKAKPAGIYRRPILVAYIFGKRRFKGGGRNEISKKHFVISLFCLLINN